jgi:cell wall-associated NlpC family hydrolase
MGKPADCQQRPGAHYRRIAVMALSAAALLAACGGGPPARPTPPAATARAWAVVPPADPVRANAVLMRAISLVGTPYRYGGNTPEGGFDCSGLVNYVYRDMLDLRLPRTSRELAQVQGPRIGASDLAGGDLVFFGRDGGVSHVGIYVGEGRFGTVRLDRLDGPWWRDHYSGARRLLN